MAPKPFASGHLLAAADLNDLVGVYDRSSSVVDVNTTTTETSVYSKSIGAGHMSTDRMLRLTLKGTYLNNSGVGVQCRVRVKFGGVTIWDHDVNAFSTSATRRRIRLLLEIQQKGTTSSQEVDGIFSSSDAAAATAGLGTASGVTYGTGAGSHMHVPFGSNADPAVDTTAARTLEVTVQHNVSSASVSFLKKSALLELL
jgi:hypothetical protein